MRNESCRKCGDRMDVNQNCQVCTKTIDYVCHKCGITTQKQIHSECMIKNIPIAG